MNRRRFLALLGAAAATAAVDPERLLWTPGQRTHILAPARGWRASYWTIPEGYVLERLRDPVVEAQLGRIREYQREIRRHLTFNIRADLTALQRELNDAQSLLIDVINSAPPPTFILRPKA